jgi:hypothetical protein
VGDRHDIYGVLQNVQVVLINNSFSGLGTKQMTEPGQAEGMFFA